MLVNFVSFLFFYHFRAKIANTFNAVEGLFEAISNVQEPGNKVAMEIDSNLLLELAYNKARLEAKVLKERTGLQMRVLYLPAHHRLFNSFNKRFVQMIEAGLIDKFIREAEKVFIKDPDEKLEEPYKALTLEELEAGFVICTAPLLFALVIFWIEWIVRLKHLLVVYFTFKSYYMLRT